MRVIPTFALCLVLASLAVFSAASPIPSARPAERWLREQWTAHWITAPDAPANDYGVYLFRKELSVAEKPGRFIVHVAADARYRLFVNGESVAYGPQRSDEWIWRYDSIDLAPWLRDGTNVIAAQVWSYGDLAPYAIVGKRTGLLIQGDSDAEQLVNTNDTWRVAHDLSRTPNRFSLPTYVVVGPGDRFDASAHPWGWSNADFDAAAWSAPRLTGLGNPYGRGTDINHWLMPRSIPLMEETQVRFVQVRRTEGVEAPTGFVEGNAPLEVPPQTRAIVLLDNGVETNATPQLTVSGGKGSRVRIVYAEALIDEKGAKGNRDEVEGRHIAGVTDEFLPDGGEQRLFTTLAFRTYRYVQLEIETAAEPLRIDDLHGVFTGYPFEERGAFTSDDAELAKIWEVGWRTARLCAIETYVDCPYYEQLQYVGDTRIQALISLYVSGDDRLMRNAIELYDRSRLAEGLTQSRYPSIVPQVINTFSLFWIDMVHDYWMHRPDEAFVRDRLAGVEAVLGWFERRVEPETGMLGPLTYWTFVDWTNEWPWDNARGTGGDPPGAHDGGSAIVTLQLACTLQRAAELFRAFSRDDDAVRCETRAASLIEAVRERCWDNERRMFADTPAKKSFSQHANTFAVLAGAVEGEEATDLIRRTVADATLVQASTYFRFYLLRAMKRVGLGDQYLAQLGPWRTMLERGLTTFAEKPDPTRSDCHAWSSSPVYEFLATVCGVEPASPGFATVRIEPHFGHLTRAEGVVPHPNGEIRVAYERDGASLKAQISLPEGVSGTFRWQGNERPLHAGVQTVTVAAK
ncbi:MAG TPA: family 78 glycoside hydrolase catalytic domain [Opitutaceae bacterium]|nr:family 78 glycoside hydrolase catalytic domain [Opitutaceae bacterium]